MAFERNDIVNKTRLMGELGEELMGFEHNDIVTVDKMNEAIAEGGGGGGLTPYTVTLAYAEGATPAYFHGGIGYDMDLGTQAESVIKILDAYYVEPNGQISAGIYEIIPLFEGGAGYFSCSSDTAATITGDATIIYDEVYESYYVKVTGDCSITITE